MIDFSKLIRSFRYGFAGLVYVIRSEQNMRIHLLITVCVIAAASFFQVSSIEWLMIVFCIGAVTAAEAMNSAIERLADRVTSSEDQLIRVAKDAAAGGVLALAISSAVIGAIIFLPRLLGLFGE